MSVERNQGNRLAENPNPPHFPENVDRLNELFGGSAMSFNLQDLNDLARSLKGFTDGVLDVALSYDADHREYVWFAGIIFRRNGFEVVTAFPWKRDEKDEKGIKNDRSIAFYTKAEVEPEIIEDLCRDWIEAFREGLSKK